jgi:PHD/YefM family antitoxin component YafN of YafNO toxin-antitoxin module
MEVSDLRPGAEQAAEAGERVVLTRKGAPVAAVVSLEDLRQLEAIEAEEDQGDAEAAAKALEDIRAGREQTVPLDHVLTEFGLTRGDLPR